MNYTYIPWRLCQISLDNMEIVTNIIGHLGDCDLYHSTPWRLWFCPKYLFFCRCSTNMLNVIVWSIYGPATSLSGWSRYMFMLLSPPLTCFFPGCLPTIWVHVAGWGNEEESTSGTGIYPGEFLLRLLLLLLLLPLLLLPLFLRLLLLLLLPLPQEAANSEKVARQFRDCDWLKVPRICWPLTSDR